jgi:zinc protease
VKSFTRKDCLAHHATFLRPGGAFLALAGDASAEEAFDACERSFGRWKSGPVDLAPLPRVAAISGREILLVDRPDATQAQVRMACLGPDRRDPKLIAARLSNQVFGSGFTSRLVNEIRVNRGLSYGVSTGLSESEAGGLVVFASFTKSESTRELIDVFLDQAARYREEGPSEEELLRAKRYTNGLFPLGLETVDQMARAIAETRRHGRGADWLERYRERVLEVTRDEAREVARRYFFAAGHAIAVVGRAKALIGPLRSLGRVRVVRPESLS